MEIKSLTTKQRKVEDGNRRSGSGVDSPFVYLEEMVAVLATRVVFEPPELA